VEPVDRRVWGLAGVGAGGFGLAGVYLLSGGRVGIPCPLHLLTGLDCPFCGSTRMAAALLRGDLAAAWQFNAAVLVIGPLLGVALGYQILVWLLERAGWLKLPRLQLGSRGVQLVTATLMSVFVVFGVLRNFF
jgi:hypothetical protein